MKTCTGVCNGKAAYLGTGWAVWYISRRCSSTCLIKLHPFRMTAPNLTAYTPVVACKEDMKTCTCLFVVMGREQAAGMHTHSIIRMKSPMSACNVCCERKVWSTPCPIEQPLQTSLHDGWMAPGCISGLCFVARAVTTKAGRHYATDCSALLACYCHPNQRPWLLRFSCSASPSK